MVDFDARVAGLVSWSEDVRAALRRLDPAQSRVLKMIYFERRTHAQVARELDVSPRAVSKTLAAGMQALGLAMLAAPVD